MDKGYFSYIRVSTVRQGQTGTSLTEQQEAIRQYANRSNLSIVREFEEKETAAKRGRPVFRQMLAALKRGQANGVIIHKIDRSARNLRDWAELGEMIDAGIEVRFANENLDLDSRGGRLSADIQAVVAADYIRNLREEVRKGFYGRLKQGFYPMRAPIGYLDKGAGKPKEIDPVRGPLIKRAFELYARGDVSVRDLAARMKEAGLRSRSRFNVSDKSMYTILHNPFYTGLIRIGEELFVGRHQPLISRALFDEVQLALSSRHTKKIRKHDFLFRRLLECAVCRSKLYGEIQKGKAYYRCQNRRCTQKTIREDIVNAAIIEVLNHIRFNAEETQYLHREITRRYEESEQLQASLKDTLTLQVEQSKSRFNALTDAYLDGVLDKESYLSKKNSLVSEAQSLSEKLDRVKRGEHSLTRKLNEILELANTAYLSYQMGSNEEKRQMVRSVISNLSVRDKSLLIKLNSPFEIMVRGDVVSSGGPIRKCSRTLSRLVSQLFKYFKSRKDKDE